MRRILAAASLCFLIFTPAFGEQITVTPAASGGGGGSGTVTNVSVTTANGVSGTVANQTTTPAISLTLGAITPTTVNGNTVPTASDTVALLAAAQTLSSKTLASAIFSTGATFSFITGSTQCLQVNTSGVLSGTGSACGSGGSTTITAGTTPTSGFTSGDLIATAGAVATDSGIATSAVVTLTGTQTLTNKSIAASEVNSGTLAAAQMPAFTGDATSSAGAVALTLATVNANVGTFGSATTCVTTTQNAKGLTTAISAATCTPAIGSITGLGTGVATLLANASSGTGAPLGGTAPTMSSATINTALTLGFLTGAGTECMQVSNTGVVSGTGSACGSGGGITSLTPGAGLVSSTAAAYSQTAITSTGTVSAAETVNAQTGTTYAIVDGDRAKLVTGTNAAAQAYTIAAAGASTTFQTGWFTRVQNKGAGILVITPTTSTICGLTTLAIYPGQTWKISSDGTNYQCDGGTTGGVAVNPESGANYPIVVSDFGKLVNLSNASNQIPTLPVASAVGANWFTEACNQGAGTQTITPTTSTIGGASTFVLPAGSAVAPKCVGIVSDGTNYQVVPYFAPGTAAAQNTGTSGATLPFLNGTNTWSGTQTFGSVFGTVTTQSGTTYTLVSTDCGTEIAFTNAAAVTVTIPAALTTGCNIAILQTTSAGQVTVTGTAVSAATLHSGHSYTKTFGQWAVIGINIYTTGVAILTGDGA